MSKPISQSIFSISTVKFLFNLLIILFLICFFATIKNEAQISRISPGKSVFIISNTLEDNDFKLSQALSRPLFVKFGSDSSKDQILNKFQPEELDDLLTIAVKKAINDKAGLCRDITPLITIFIKKNPSEANATIASAREKLGGDIASLTLLNEIVENRCSETQKPFESLSVKNEGSAERLALLAIITTKTDSPGILYDAIDAFIKANEFSPEIFALASRVQVLADNPRNLASSTWRDEFLRYALRSGWDQNDLIAGATGSDIPERWKIAEQFLEHLTDKKLADLRSEETWNQERRKDRPFALHPLVLRLLNSKRFKANELTSTGTLEFISWLAERSKDEPEIAFTAGVIVLETASKMGVSINEKGEVQGNIEWATAVRKVLDVIVSGSIPDKNLPSSWQNRQARFDELYRSCKTCQQKILNTNSLADALRRYGRTKMFSVWQNFNDKSEMRAIEITSSSEKGAVEKAVKEGRIDREKMDSIIQSPFCAPWLVTVSEILPPKSLEAGILVRWYVSRLKPRDLLFALENQWQPLTVDPANKNSTSPGERLVSIEKFSAWELTRGAWSKVTVNSPADFQLQSPWTEIDTSSLIADKLKYLKNWDPSQPLARQDAGIPAALTAVCWFGLPAGNDGKELQSKLTEGIGKSLNQDEKVFLTAVRMEFATTSMAAGEDLRKVINDNPFLGTTEIETLPQTVDILYKDGRPFAVRAAADITWLVGKRYLISQSLNDSNSVVRNYFQTGGSRDISRSMLKALDPLLKQAVEATVSGKMHSGYVTDLASLQIDLSVEGSKNKRVALNVFAAKTFQPALLGSSFWGIDIWLGQWERELQGVSENRLLTIEPPSFESDKFTNQKLFLGTVMAIFDNSISLEKLSPDTWRNPLFWSNIIRRTDPGSKKLTTTGVQSNSSVTPAKVPIISFPWDNADQPNALFQPLLDKYLLIERATSMISDSKTDLDGLNEKYLPSTNWLANRNKLDESQRKLVALEASIRSQYNAIQLEDMVKSLKPLLSAPLVVNKASFENDLNASIADVRKTESMLGVRQQESIAAQLEVEAQFYLTKVTELEIERTKALEIIKKNESDIAKINQQLEEKNNEIAKLDANIADDKAKIAGFEVEKQKIEVQKGELEIVSATQAVVVLKNRLQLLNDILFTETPVPDEPSAKRQKGQLGVLAYMFERQILAQKEAINQNIADTEQQLANLRESGLIRGIAKFIGTVVGYVFGGQNGAQLGALIGDTVGGIVAGIKQKKSFGEIASKTVRNVFQIADQYGVNLDQETKKYVSGSLGKDAEDARNLIALILKEIPKFLSKDDVERAFSFNHADKDLEKVLNDVKKGILDGLRPLELAAQHNEFIKKVGPIVLTGTPEEIKEKLFMQILTSLNIMSEKDLQKIADELKIVYGKDEKSRKLMAEKLATLGIVKALPQIVEARDRSIERLLGSLTTLQNVLKKGAYKNIEEALRDQVFQSDEFKEHKEQIAWIGMVYGALTVEPNQEIAWRQLEPKLREALGEIFPGDPERREILIGEFKLRLDSNGIQAEIRELIEPWYRETQAKMNSASEALNTPCNDDDEEKRGKCQLQVLGNGRGKLDELISWLKDRTQKPYTDLEGEIDKKMRDLETANNNLLAKKAEWEAVGLTLKQAEAFKNIAETGKQIAELKKSTAALLVQKVDLAFENAKQEEIMAKLKAEKDLLNQSTSQARLQALKAKADAAKNLVKAAEADLQSSRALEAAARSRGVVYGKIADWNSNSDLSDPPQSITELNKLIEQHSLEVSGAGEVVRDMLRVLRAAGGDYKGFEPAGVDKNWSEQIKDINTALDTRFNDLKTKEDSSIQIELNTKQIEELFSNGGLNLFIKPLSTPKAASLETDNDAPNTYSIPGSKQYQVVYFAFLMAADKDGQPIKQLGWKRSLIRCDALVPIDFDAASKQFDYLLTKGDFEEKNCAEKIEKTDSALYMRIEKNEGRLPEKTKFISDNDVQQNYVTTAVESKNITGTQSRESFLSQSAIPLTGHILIKVAGAPQPARVRLVLVYRAMARIP